MRNGSEWRPSKFVYREGRLVASRDASQVAVGSRLVAGLVAQHYQDAFSKYAKGRLLDMGCGKVPFFEAYKPFVSDVTCIDWANSQHPNRHVDLECDLSEVIPCKSESFDTIILSDVLEHLPEPEKCWHEMSRLLAPGGHALINVPFYYQLHETPYDFYRYTEFALRRFAEIAELHVTDLRTIGGAPEIICDTVSKLVAGRRLGNLLASGIQATCAKLSQTGWGKRASRRTGVRFPLGYFLVVMKPSLERRGSGV